MKLRKLYLQAPAKTFDTWLGLWYPTKPYFFIFTKLTARFKCISWPKKMSAYFGTPLII